MFILRWEAHDETGLDMVAILDVIEVARFEHLLLALDVRDFMIYREAKAPKAGNYRLAVVPSAIHSKQEG